MHALGAPDLGLAPEHTFPGQSLFAHLGPIKQLVRATGAKTILDYGSGKGLQYRPQKIVVDGKYVADGVAEYWDVDEVRCYDPGYPLHAALPDGAFDGVVCTDVLEHCPEDDLRWILDEIFAYARSFVYLNVACFLARKTLPNGENAHATVRPPEWWRDVVSERAAAHGGMAWELRASYPESGKIAEKVFRSADRQKHGDDLDLITSVSIDGRKAVFSTPNEMTRWRVNTLYTKEPVTIEWLRSIDAGAVLVDVGANVGIYTVFAALASQARVFAFEPESQNYALLNENVRLNGLADRVVAICAGLSDRTGIERLFLSKAVAGASCHSLGAEVGYRLEPRKTAFAQGAIALRLDDLVAAGSLPIPQYIKIDVDGFEHQVIGGMEQTLRNEKVRSLIVELNPQLVEHRNVRERLAALGFRWDAAQVSSAARKTGPFKGVAEHVFSR
jgi:FkbM family methyltransferase